MARRTNGHEQISELADFVQEGRLPSRELIRKEVGEYAIFPVYFSLATAFEGDPRKTGFPKAKHPLETMIRDDVWNFKWRNTEESNKILAFHDVAEDESESVAGAFTLCEWIGDVFEEQYMQKGYGIAAQTMTDWNTMILKEVKRRGSRLTSKAPDEITFEDIRLDFDEIRGTFVDQYAKRRKSDLQSMRDRVLRFKFYASDSPLDREDKSYASDVATNLIDSINRRIAKESEELKKFKEFIEKKCEDLDLALADETLQKIAKREEYEATRFHGFVNDVIGIDRSKDRIPAISFFDGKGSPAFHAALKAVYKAYVSDVVFFDDNAYENLPFTSWDLAGAKIDDRSDNIRIPAWNNMDRAGREYMKTAIISKKVQAKLQAYGKQDKRAKLLKNQLNYLNGQLVCRVVLDNYHAAPEFDTGFDITRAWLPMQFSYAYNSLGGRFMNQCRKNIHENPKTTVAARKDQVRHLFKMFDELMEKYVQSPEAREFRREFYQKAA